MKNRKKIHDNWKTPDEFYNKLNKEFHFDFDPCPLDANFDGLSIEWGTSNYINPPYDRKLKEAFVEKALAESKKGKTCVCLLPVSTSTRLFHDVILPNAKEVRFIRGRIKFEGYNSEGTFVSDKTGQHDSMIVVFKEKDNENKE